MLFNIHAQKIETVAYCVDNQHLFCLCLPLFNNRQYRHIQCANSIVIYSMDFILIIAYCFCSSCTINEHTFTKGNDNTQTVTLICHCQMFSQKVIFIFWRLQVPFHQHPQLPSNFSISTVRSIIVEQCLTTAHSEIKGFMLSCV